MPDKDDRSIMREGWEGHFSIADKVSAQADGAGRAWRHCGGPLLIS